MARKAYTIDGVTYLCKIPDVSEQWALRGKLPLLPHIKTKDKVTVSVETPQMLLESLEFANVVLIRCGIEPRFIAGSPVVIPPGCVPVDEVDPQVRFQLFTELMTDGGFTKEAAEEIRPTSATTEAP